MLGFVVTGGWGSRPCEAKRYDDRLAVRVPHVGWRIVCPCILVRGLFFCGDDMSLPLDELYATRLTPCNTHLALDHYRGYGVRDSKSSTCAFSPLISCYGGIARR